MLPAALSTSQSRRRGPYAAVAQSVHDGADGSHVAAAAHVVQLAALAVVNWRVPCKQAAARGRSTTCGVFTAAAAAAGSGAAAPAAAGSAKPKSLSTTSGHSRWRFARLVALHSKAVSGA